MWFAPMQRTGARRRVEVISGLERRRRWSEEQKRAIVAEVFAPDASVSAVAQRVDVVPGQILSLAPGAPQRGRKPKGQPSRSKLAATSGFAFPRPPPRSWHARSSRPWWRDDWLPIGVGVWIAVSRRALLSGLAASSRHPKGSALIGSSTAAHWIGSELEALATTWGNSNRWF
jgi:hypothetical protein